MGEEKSCPCAAVIQAQKEIKDHTDQLYAGDTRFEVMKVQLSAIATDTQEIKADLKALKEEPGRKWKGITSKVVDWAVILLLAYVAMQIGLK